MKDRVQRHPKHSSGSQREKRIAQRKRLIALTPEQLLGFSPSLKADERSYDPENAFFFGTMAGAAYFTADADPTIDDWFDEGFLAKFPNAESVEIFPENSEDTEGFVLTTADAIVVTLCGTNSMSDWLTNVNMALERQAGGFVHRGFWKALDVVWPVILEAIQKGRADDPEKPLWFCGHSLGGALSVLSALRCIDEGVPLHGVYTYGQPLVGEGQLNSALASIEDRIFRIVNEGDLVPLIPFSTTKPLVRAKMVKGANGRLRRVTREPAQFGEVGRYYVFDEDGRLRHLVTAPPRNESQAKNLIDALVSLAKKALDIKKHGMEVYLNKLDAVRVEEKAMERKAPRKGA